MTKDRATYSRFQVLSAGYEAWRDGDRAADGAFHYDGISFWRLQPDGGRRLLPSWRTPGHGWRHTDDCSCELCSARRPAATRPLSVA